MTITTASSNRRALLKFGAAASIAGFAVPALAHTPSADAELIAACAEYDGLNRHWFDVSNPDDTDEQVEAAQKALKARIDHVLDRICSLQATTAEGFKARGATLAQFVPEMLKEWEKSSYHDDRMLAALLRDLTIEGVQL